MNADITRTDERGLDALVKLLDRANVIVHDLTGSISRWSGGCEALYGWTRQEVLGRHVQDVLRTQVSQSREDILKSITETGFWFGEIIHHHRNGRSIALSSQWVGLTLEPEDKFIIVQLNSEVSELKDIQVDLAAREAHLRSILEINKEIKNNNKKKKI